MVGFRRLRLSSTTHLRKIGGGAAPGSLGKAASKTPDRQLGANGGTLQEG